MMGLKVAYKGVKLYQEKKQELLDFEEDYDELYLRLAAAEPILNGLEGNLNENLALTLTLTKNELEKCAKYCEKLLAYCRKFNGFPMRTMANAIVGMGIGMLPEALQGPANDLLETVGTAGIPEKAFMKYADKIHFLMTALSGAATTQVLLNQARAPAAQAPNSYSLVPAVEMSATTTSPSDLPTPPPVSKPIPPPSTEMSMASILEDNINESEEEIKVILVSGKKNGKGNPWLYAVWLNKVPHLLIVEYILYTPAVLMIRRAPDNDFILKLQSNGLDAPDCAAKLFCATKRSRINNTMKRCMMLTCSKLNMNQFMYRWHYQKTVNNKILLIPYVGMLVYCFSCLCTTLTLQGFEADKKKYHIQIRDSCDLYINYECKFKASDAPKQD